MAHRAVIRTSSSAPVALLALALGAVGCFDDPAAPSADAGALDAGRDVGVDTGAGRDVVREDLPPLELRPTNVDLTLRERAPASLTEVNLPMGAEPVGAYVSREGEGLVVARDGRFFALDGRGSPILLERLPDDPRAPGDAPVTAVLERAPEEVVALVATGVLTYRGGWVRRESFAPLLATARATASWGNESLWMTGQGLYTTQGSRWLQLERGGMPVTDAVAAVAGPSGTDGREAWVLRSGGALERLRVRPMGEGLEVVWSLPVVGCRRRWCGPSRCTRARGTSRGRPTSSGGQRGTGGAAAGAGCVCRACGARIGGALAVGCLGGRRRQPAGPHRRHDRGGDRARAWRHGAAYRGRSRRG